MEFQEAQFSRTYRDYSQPVFRMAMVYLGKRENAGKTGSPSEPNTAKTVRTGNIFIFTSTCRIKYNKRKWDL